MYNINLFISYRIEHAMSNNKLRDINPKNKLLIFEGLIWAVDIHRQAMKYIFDNVLGLLLFVI